MPISSKTDLDRFIDKVIEIVPDALNEALERGRNVSVAKVPVITGRLKGSIRTELIHDFKGVIATNVEYAAFVEFGTSRQRAQPYLWPGYLAARKALPKVLSRRIATELREFL